MFPKVFQQDWLSGIQQRLELVDGVAELVCAAEFADDFIDVAVIGYATILRSCHFQ